MINNPNISNAMSAYAQALKVGAGDKMDARDVAGPSFGDLMASGVEKAIEVQKTSEKVSADAVLGKADLTDVVQAVNNAEVTLDLVVSVRDKVIEAYETIMRMSI